MLNLLLVESGVENAALQNALAEESVETVTMPYSALFVSKVKEMQPDAVVIYLDTPSEEILADLATLNRQHPVPVAMFANNVCSAAIQKAVQAEVGALVIDGFSPQRVHSVVQVALARFKHQQTLKTQLQDAKTQLEDRKYIDRAKAILINTQNFTEHEAYHTLRKLAMDRNITLGQMARNVIAMAELLK